MPATPYDVTITISDAQPVREILDALGAMMQEMERRGDLTYDAYVQRIRTAVSALPVAHEPT